ncbi:TatD family hydrolase [Litoribacter ruber]|uniref:TatD family hydrolase n=1 Tax=Litoribacter ruber TaxID=702568 RepID=A0AAP2CHV3_9BACT|nr:MULTISPECIES: TatD family hydrolase [Litoribacter]MBS9524110.1 TatD family hydrolase [Litoribacter alkaliphilus]MBT0811306.1 TatD family hydrolase [Litoribacter ruber]
MYLVDSHAHIYSKKYDDDRDAIIASCLEKGVNKIYMPNIDVESIDAMLEAEHKYPDVCIPTMGLHPCDVDKDFDKQLYVMEDWLKKRPFAAVGEIGLDLYWDKTFFEHQKEALRIQIRWAIEKGYPIILHCRDSIDQTIQVVKEEFKDGLKGVFHCFSGNLQQAKEILDMGFLLGIGGVATFKNGGLDAVLPEVGLEHLILETDGPYLAPVPYRGKRNSPEYIPIIAQRVGDLTENTLEKVAEVTTKNTEKLFSPIKS